MCVHLDRRNNTQAIWRWIGVVNSGEHFEAQFGTQPGMNTGFAEILEVKPVQEEDAFNLAWLNIPKLPL